MRQARNFEPVWGRRPRRSGSPVTRDAQSVLGTALPPLPLVTAAPAPALPPAAAAATPPAAVPAAAPASAAAAAAAVATAAASSTAPAAASVPEVKPKRSWATPPPDSADKAAGADEEGKWCSVGHWYCHDTSSGARATVLCLQDVRKLP